MIQENRVLRPGEFAYVRVKIKALASDIFGQYEVEPINKFGQPEFEGKYMYVMRSELITADEARRSVKT